jgi:hypothetical protein
VDRERVAVFVVFALADAGLAAAFPIALSLAREAGRRADDSGANGKSPS